MEHDKQHMAHSYLVMLAWVQSKAALGLGPTFAHMNSQVKVERAAMHCAKQTACLLLGS